ncbi:MAG: hypothetical protein GF330_12990 [Candidatus Eisenbacteria bacterium]|nr:hypothetical protein [Candidatus Eisenbacteria bacterium]
MTSGRAVRSFRGLRPQQGRIQASPAGDHQGELLDRLARELGSMNRGQAIQHGGHPLWPPARGVLAASQPHPLRPNAGMAFAEGDGSQRLPAAAARIRGRWPDSPPSPASVCRRVAARGPSPADAGRTRGARARERPATARVQGTRPCARASNGLRWRVWPIDGESEEIVMDKVTVAWAIVVGLAGIASAGMVNREAVAPVVEANSAFALDLYKQLAKENAGENLFFSPYSISSALAMTAEGARGETAVEMGKVLCFPAAVRRQGEAVQPWEMALIHQGIAAINRRISQPDKAPEDAAATRARIDGLREQLDATKARIAELRKQRKWRETRPLQEQERDLAAQINRLAAQVDQYEIHAANALWGEQTYPFKPDFVETIAQHYGTGGVFPCDFRNHFPAARERINAWAAEQTHNRIEKIIPQLPPEQARLIRLVLTNAIYFKGEWAEPFQAKNTEDRDFTLAGGTPVKAPIMSARELEVVRYAAFNADGSFFDTPRRMRPGQREGLYPDAGGFAVLELPYKGDELAMVVVAPNKPDGLPALEKLLTREALAGWIARTQKRKTHVLLPRFKLETDYGMSETLQAMGMVRAFIDPGRDPAKGADFSGMTTSTKPEDRLFISKVLHKAFVEVNEKGTEAAAVTAVVMAGATAMPTTVPFTPTFKADRPFLLLIRDRVTESILFLGRVTNPKG